jgi:microcompartment protein CcmL/EutN
VTETGIISSLVVPPKVEETKHVAPKEETTTEEKETELETPKKEESKPKETNEAIKKAENTTE